MMLSTEKTTHLAATQSTRMSAEEEYRLAKLWRTQGDKSARERLITENLGLVVAIAQHYRHRGVPMGELIAEGNLGLLHAVDGFDPDRGCRLSTYAVYWIRQGFSRAFAANSPRGQMNGRDRRDVTQLEQAVRLQYAISGREPTIAELAEAMQWPRQRVSACKRLAARFSRPASLDPSRPTVDVQPEWIADSPDASEEHGSATATVASLFKDLSDKERAVVEMRFGMHGSEALGVDEIAASLSTSRRETRALLRTAVSKLTRRGGRAAVAGLTRAETLESLAS